MQRANRPPSVAGTIIAGAICAMLVSVGAGATGVQVYPGAGDAVAVCGGCDGINGVGGYGTSPSVDGVGAFGGDNPDGSDGVGVF